MNNIKKFRLQKGWSHADLANVLGFKRQNIGMLESKRSKVREKTMEKIATAFDVSAFELYGEDIFYVAPKNDKEVLITLKVLANIAENPELKEKIKGML